MRLLAGQDKTFKNDVDDFIKTKIEGLREFS